jgi:FtsP/CotA-like multicopper oxidase with cupredoxin domain
MITRRKMMFSGAAAVASGSLLLQGAGIVQADEAPPTDAPATAPGQQNGDASPLPPGEPGKNYTPVITPNGTTLPFKIVDGVKVFHLIAEEVDHEFAPGLKAKCWGYNGRTSGPTIEAVEGDRVRIYVTNRLPEPTSVHWHGVLLPNGMDGVAGLNQKAIPPNETFKYEFALRQHGTHMYHPHFDEMTQMGLGMMGMFIIHPRSPKGPRPDRDFAIMLSEWRIDPGTSRPNPNEMVEFNVLTMNSKAFPGTAPLVAKFGDRVRIRFGNLGAMDHHPIHMHGMFFKITETDGGQVPEAAQSPSNTVLVAVGQTRAVDFVADEPGDWAMHCHMTHHVMNQMGHGTPNMIGVQTGNLDKKVQGLLPAYMTMGDTGMGDMAMMGMPVPKNSIPMGGGEGAFGTIDMGGMFTILKVRKGIGSYEDPGWYEHPKGTLTEAAAAADLRRDGIDVSARSTPVGTVPAASSAASMVKPPAAAGFIYTCVMHPDVMQDHPGKCPKCGMKLVLKK